MKRPKFNFNLLTKTATKNKLTISPLKVRSGQTGPTSIIACRLVSNPQKLPMSTRSIAMLPRSDPLLLLCTNLIARVQRHSGSIQRLPEKLTTMTWRSSPPTRRKRRPSSARIGRKEPASLETSAPLLMELKTCTRRLTLLPAIKLLSARPTTRRLTSASTAIAASLLTSHVTSVPLLKDR